MKIKAAETDLLSNVNSTLVNDLLDIKTLEEYLSSRDWNITNRTFIKDGDLYKTTSSNSNVSDPTQYILKNSEEEIKFSSSLNNMNLTTIKDGCGLMSYKDLVSEYDYINKSGMIDVIPFDSDFFISTVNLSAFKEIGQNIVCHLIVNSDSSTSINSPIVLTLVPFNQNGEPLDTKFTTSDVDIEYQFGCIRVFSKKGKVATIINCYLTYER